MEFKISVNFNAFGVIAKNQDFEHINRFYLAENYSNRNSENFAENISVKLFTGEIFGYVICDPDSAPSNTAKYRLFKNIQ